jgi:hypothetical protein
MWGAMLANFRVYNIAISDEQIQAVRINEWLTRLSQ